MENMEAPVPAVHVPAHVPAHVPVPVPVPVAEENKVTKCCCCNNVINNIIQISIQIQGDNKNGAKIQKGPMSIWCSPFQNADNAERLSAITLHHMACKLGCFKHRKSTEKDLMVCSSCITKLTSAYCFRTMCLHNEKQDNMGNNAAEESDDSLSRRRRKERSKKHSKRLTISKDKKKKTKFTVCSVELVKKIVVDCLNTPGMLKQVNPTAPDIVLPLSALTLQDKSENM